MSDSKPSLPATLGRVSFWLVVAMTAAYVGFFEAAYRSDAACRGATRWTRVVVDSSLSGANDLNELIAIGSNAGYVIVISGAKCSLKRRTSTPPGNDGWRLRDVLRDLGRPAIDRGHFLWLWMKKEVRGDLPQAMVVPLSRVLCMYDYDDRTGAGSPCTPRPSSTPEETPEESDTNLSRIEERLKTEIRNELAKTTPKCTDDLRISPPVVFRPHKSDQLVATTGPDSLEHAVQSLKLEDANANGGQLYVFGYASADGPRDYNRTLSKQRADHVRKLVEKETPVADTFPMGEDHLVNGVAESRGVRLVACVPSQPSQ